MGEEQMARSSRQPLIEFLSNVPDHDMGILFAALDVAHEHLVYESTEEKLLVEQFMTSLWIAARGDSIG